MLKDFGVQLVLIGHSERRSLYGETDTAGCGKIARGVEAGLTPVICVGETLSERESGQAQAVVLRQLKAVADVSACQDCHVKAYFAVTGQSRLATMATGRNSTSCCVSEITDCDIMILRKRKHMIMLAVAC